VKRRSAIAAFLWVMAGGVSEIVNLKLKIFDVLCDRAESMRSLFGV